MLPSVIPLISPHLISAQLNTAAAAVKLFLCQTSVIKLDKVLIDKKKKHDILRGC